MQREAFLVQSPSHRTLRALNYTPAVESLRRTRSGKRSIPMSAAAAEVGLGYSTVFARIDASPEHGVELLSQKDMFGAEPTGRWIRRDSMARPERHEVRRWQVLIAGAGTLGENELYGRPIIADNRLAGKYVGQDTLVICFDPPGSDLNLYTYAFLASPTGVKALRSASYGTKILRIRKSILSDLPIPLPDDHTVERVARLVRETVEQRELYAARLASARNVIEKLPEMVEALQMCADRRARCITWSGPLPTMRAWNYASAGPALARLRDCWRARLADVVAGIKAKRRFARVNCEAPHGVQLVSQRDVFMMRRFARRIVRPNVPEADIFADETTLLIARDGQFSEGSLFGKAEMAAAGLTHAAISEHLMQLVVTPKWSPLVFAYLTTAVGQRLTRTTATGTSIPTIREDLFLDLPFPDFGNSVAARVAADVHAANVARSRADTAENEAVRIVEEEVLPQWLA